MFKVGDYVSAYLENCFGVGSFGKIVSIDETNNTCIVCYQSYNKAYQAKTYNLAELELFDPSIAYTEVLELAKDKLSKVDKVDGAFWFGDFYTLKIYVIVKEHGICDRDSLFEVEDLLNQNTFAKVEVQVNARQNRSIDEIYGIGHRLF